MPALSPPALATRYASRLREHFGDRVRGVWLFGSYARGDARETSDIDVAASVAGLTWREKCDAIDLATDAALGSGIPLSALVMEAGEFERLRGLELRLVLDILREGWPL